MTTPSMTDLVTSLDSLFHQDLQTLREVLTGQESLSETDIQKVVPQARSVFLRKILSRMLAMCCEEMTLSAGQELKILHSVIGALLPQEGQAGDSLTDFDRQRQAFDKQTAEFNKNIAKKEKIIADQILKSQKHIAGLQKKMMRPQ